MVEKKYRSNMQVPIVKKTFKIKTVIKIDYSKLNIKYTFKAHKEKTCNVCVEWPSFRKQM